MDKASSLAAAVASFVRSYPHDVEFPLAEGIAIPTSSELCFAETLERLSPVSPSDVDSARQSLFIRQGYSLAVFAVRMAVLAARTNSPKMLSVGMLGLVLDDRAIDERDVLRALSIIEYCADRLGTDFGSMIGSLRDIASARRRRTIFDDYLARSKAWRGISAMGFYAVEDEGKLSFKNKF